MQDPPEDVNPSTANPLKKRDPELVNNFALFRLRIGDILLDSLAPVLADTRIRARHGQDLLADLHAVAQVLRILVKDDWTEHDLDNFDKYWRQAIRSDFFGDEFEAERHRIQTSVETARTKLLGSETSIPSPKMKQPTLW